MLDVHRRNLRTWPWKDLLLYGIVYGPFSVHLRTAGRLTTQR